MSAGNKSTKRISRSSILKIISTNPSDILEALGEEWAMTGDYQLLHMHQEWMEFDDNFVKLPTLPKNLSDLSLPEYEETRKQLIQLLMK